jgi:type 1 glutamine amidotransferase
MKRILSGLAGLVVLLGLLALTAPADEARTGTKKRLLVITESRGFVHGVVNRGGDYRGDFTANKLSVLTLNGKELSATDQLNLTARDGKVTAILNGQEVPFTSYANNQPCLVEKTLMEVGAKHGFEVVCSQDSRKEITAENLSQFDAVFFYTTGELPLSETQKADLLQFVRSGKGFAGSHCATDTFYRWPEYGNMIGAYFDGHPWTTNITAVVEDTSHPATAHLGEKFQINDEIYQFKAPYGREQLHVLMRLEPKWAEESRDKELKGIETVKADLQAKIAKLADAGRAEEAKKLQAEADGRKPGIHRTDGDFALSWTREYGKGRVFYTALGHRDEVWKDERFQKHVVGGLNYVFRLAEGDATPSAQRKR